MKHIKMLPLDGKENQHPGSVLLLVAAAQRMRGFRV